VFDDPAYAAQATFYLEPNRQELFDDPGVGEQMFCDVGRGKCVFSRYRCQIDDNLVGQVTI